MFIIIAGNVVDGLVFVGPFTSHQAANEYAFGDAMRGTREAWWIAKLVNPDNSNIFAVDRDNKKGK
jgi:hypothetical protein